MNNGPLGMYTVKPLYEPCVKLDLPTCMYRMKRVIEDDYSPSLSSEDPPQEGAHALTDAENYQLQIIEKLENLKSQVLNFKKDLKINEASSSSKSADPTISRNMLTKPIDIVVKANPEFPPYSLWVFSKLLQDVLKVQLVTYLHSSLTALPNKAKQLHSAKDTSHFDLTLTVIWKQGIGRDAEMLISPVCQGMIEGEVNIARYLSRLFLTSYEPDPYTAAKNDNWLEAVHASYIHGSSKDQNSLLKLMNSELGKRSYLVGESLSIADIVLWSAILQTNVRPNLPANVDKWWKNLSTLPAFQIPVLS